MVNRDLEIKVRNFKNYELIIQALVDAGVSEIESPESGVDDEAKLKTAALMEATAIARQKAQQIAKGLGVQIGNPYEIGEDRLPSKEPFRQRRAYGNEIEEIVVTGSRRNYDPLLFVPDNIRVSATVWVSFRIAE